MAELWQILDNCSMTNESEITVLLLNHQRPANLPLLLDGIEQQSCSADVFLWNNAAHPLTDPRITWHVNSSDNRFCWPR